jgi:hypothetical protein
MSLIVLNQGVPNFKRKKIKNSIILETEETLFRNLTLRQKTPETPFRKYRKKGF